MNGISFLLCCFSCFCLAQRTEYFSTSQHIIRPHQYKINVVQKNYKNTAIVYFDLFSKSKNKWVKIQSGHFNKQTDFALSVSTDEDLNNDGYKDLKISYAQAARGANEIEKLLIFNPKTQKLVEIINSHEYPNLHYNAKRNCVNSYMFYGGNATLFLRINKNKLEEFGKVEFSNDSIYSYKIKNGREILLIKKPYQSDDAAVFFSNFDPIEE